MTVRASKLLLVFGVAVFYSLVVFNNITDYGSNYEFVRHAMMMDTTFPGNNGMLRAINLPLLHTAFYWTIIAWEAISMLLLWWGGFRMSRALRGTAAAFHRAKRASIAGLAESCRRAIG
jgi:predicted small integral membrane protein